MWLRGSKGKFPRIHFQNSSNPNALKSSASSRLPGSTRRSLKRPAISNSRSLRCATGAVLANRPTGIPFESACVSRHLKV